MNRLEWVLAGLLGLLLITVVGLGLMLWLRPDIGTVPLPAVDAVDAPLAPTPGISRNTAMLSFSVAQATAREWQRDARLARASAVWAQGASREDMLNGRATWDFTFLSPEAGSMALISVVEDQAKFMSEQTANQVPALADVSGWQVDSPDAVARVMEEGGEAFLRSAGASTMTATLNTAAENGRIEWFISLISKYSGESFTMRINASSGEATMVESGS